MQQQYKILVLGGYGNFGQYISRSLAANARIHLYIAGRSVPKADVLKRSLQTTVGEHAAVSTVELDINNANFANKLRELAPDLLINATGPFQQQDYQVAQACINNGIHYIDLADSREFVAGIKILDADAIKNNVCVISGASSVPGLSSAVIHHYAAEFSQVDSVGYGISPGNQTDRGVATVEAILSYTGRHFQTWVDGKYTTVFGWQNCRRYDFGKPLGRRWMANCNIPDLSLFPEYFPTIKNVNFQAGLELTVLHLAMWIMSWLSRIRLVKSWAVYAKPITQLSRLFQRFGTDDGGMFVRLTGHRDKKPYAVSWQLVALDGYGPRIPAVAAIILATKFAAGILPVCGARPCIGLFSLPEFFDVVKEWPIVEQIQRNDGSNGSEKCILQAPV